jgi:hypothetical protein
MGERIMMSMKRISEIFSAVPNDSARLAFRNA